MNAPRIDTALVHAALREPGLVLDTSWLPPTPPAPAAVLLPLRLDLASPTVVAMLRAHGLRDHAGEVAFPGGKPERGDVTLLDTALRESREEVGLGAADVEFIGMLTGVPVITGKYLIHPHVAVVHAGRAPMLGSAAEVARVIELPLIDWLTGARRWEAVRMQGSRGELVLPHFPLGDVTLYGASAYIFFDLLRRLARVLDLTLPEPVMSDSFPWANPLAQRTSE